MSNKPEAGLTSREARRRLAAAGSEVTGSNRRRSIIRILREVFSEPIFLLMLAAGGLYFVMGSAVDGAILMGFVLIIMVMTIVQERRTERVLELLRDLASPRATVVRDGLEQRIPNREVVRGDLMLLSEGDRIVADAVVIEAHEFATDESILTGESGWVPKLEAGLLVLSGTMVVRGQARVRVTAAGRATRFGQIGQTLESIAPEPSPLTRSIERLTLRLAWLGGGISLVFALIYGLRSESWLNGILSGLTLAMALLPQEFPVILIVFFALGARRMALAGVLTRRLNAIELLGKITVLCVDKTGTLTENRMSLVSLYTQGAALTLADDRATELPPSSRLLLDYAVLASEIEPRDPMELAIHSFAALNLGLEQRQPSPLKLVKEYHLSPGLMAMTHLWRGTAGEPDLVAAKGAPEAIARLCSLSESEQGQMIVAANQMAAQGLRVLAVARAQHSAAEPWPDSQTSFNFEWLGLLGLMDPLRAEVPATIAECQRAGIRVVMITGDHPVTAKAIARQAGIAESDVYARVTPTDKLAIIQRLKSEGEVVAMTGDGVNDAPALKAAQIGIAMGRRGTDVARAAAALVLLQDSFAAIVTAIRAGRLITINIKQALGYSLSLHLPIIILSFMPGILNQPLILLPIHIVFLELVFNPISSLVFEAEPASDDLMLRHPLNSQEELLSGRTLLRSLLIGLLVGSGIFIYYGWMLRQGIPTPQIRTAVFTAMVGANLGTIFIFRRRWFLARFPRTGWIAILSAMACLTLIVTVPILSQVFALGAIAIWQFASILMASLILVALGRVVISSGFEPETL